MCRLAYFKNIKGTKVYDNLPFLLQYLEEKRGGHGNGVGALIKKKGKKVFWIRKGLGYDVYMATNDIKELLPKAVNGVFFHTRLASMGKVTSRLNHPFATKHLMLIHNGANAGKDRIMMEMQKMAISFNYSKPYSDSLLLTLLLSKYYEQTRDEEMTALYALNIINPVNAVYIQFYGTGNVYLIVKQQDFQLYYDGKTVVAASEGLEVIYDRDIYTCDECIVKITKNDLETIYGELVPTWEEESTPYYEEIDYDLPLEEYEYYAKLLWREKEYM